MTRLMEVTLDPGRATLEEARQRLGLEEGELDVDYGLVEIDPEQNKYAILVDDRAAERISGHPEVKGPFANPPIEPFGPPERKR
jgi:hypothetical protein